MGSSRGRRTTWLRLAEEGVALFWFGCFLQYVEGEWNESSYKLLCLHIGVRCCNGLLFLHLLFVGLVMWVRCWVFFPRDGKGKQITSENDSPLFRRG